MILGLGATMTLHTRLGYFLPIITYLPHGQQLRPDSGKVCDPMRFRQIVGSLIYLTITRPDLSYLVGVVSQFMVRPIVEHLQCMQHILRYVRDSKDRGLLYHTGIAEQLVGYTDADWSGNAANRRSTSTWECRDYME